MKYTCGGAAEVLELVEVLDSEVDELDEVLGSLELDGVLDVGSLVELLDADVLDSDGVLDAVLPVSDLVDELVLVELAVSELSSVLDVVDPDGLDVDEVDSDEVLDALVELLSDASCLELVELLASSSWPASSFFFPASSGLTVFLPASCFVPTSSAR
jgi:hypothetical protein